MKVKYMGDRWGDFGRIAEVRKEHDYSYTVIIEDSENSSHLARWSKNDIEVIEE